MSGRSPSRARLRNAVSWSAGSPSSADKFSGLLSKSGEVDYYWGQLGAGGSPNIVAMKKIDIAALRKAAAG
jgi:hypothetical protein